VEIRQVNRRWTADPRGGGELQDPAAAQLTGALRFGRGERFEQAEAARALPESHRR
jgi:hypothetical protein